MRSAKFSPLTRRILTVNVLPLAILVAGILYLDDYRHGLIEAELTSLEVQAEIFAGALGEGAIGTRSSGEEFILPGVSRDMLRRLVGPTGIHARVFDADGSLIADSRLLGSRDVAVQVEVLPSGDELPLSILNQIYDAVTGLLPESRRDPPFPEGPITTIEDLQPLAEALDGEKRTARWALPEEGPHLGAGVAIQRFKKVLGAVLLTTDADDVSDAVREARIDILTMFLVALAITILVSLYLARGITRPIRTLAMAAESVRRGHGEANAIPDFTKRGDEIGDLSEALRDMTEALKKRMAANERFAADVSHEMKNPLTSLRSAVETVSLVEDPGRQATLLAIIGEDVKRLDRLISDIADASRLDAELARSRMSPVDLGHLLPGLVEVHITVIGDSRLRFEKMNPGPFVVMGIEDQLTQVFQNLISNARSFTPPTGTITLSAEQSGPDVVVYVDDEGTGIPPESLVSIFERFYSERPEGEDFGRHSGLGLSISRQIVEAHGGNIHAENRYGSDGQRRGARFVVRLPTRL